MRVEDEPIQHTIRKCINKLVDFVYGDDTAIKEGVDYAKYNFTDVPANAFYYEPITWAAKNGITSGISDTVFGRGRSCTRSQMVSFLQRFS